VGGGGGTAGGGAGGNTTATVVSSTVNPGPASMLMTSVCRSSAMVLSPSCVITTSASVVTAST
jgi:hypothetical protein